jgi:Tol biopolymer transport system component
VLLILLLEIYVFYGTPHARSESTQAPSGVELQAGIEKEEVDGDLKSAMEIFEKIAADNAASREVRARALLRLAGCEEKLGRQAQQVYEQIVRNYADQPAAVQARKRLALIRQQQHPVPPTAMSLRRIETSDVGGMGGTDTDGQRALYSFRGALYLGDLAAHTQHKIGDFTETASAPSRDFSMVALNLKPIPNRPHTLAVMKADGTGYRELLRDDEHQNIFGNTSSFNMTWSWDNKYVEICDFHPWSKNAGQVWIVAVADGQRRVVADQADGHVRKAVFSPDGQYVAYEAWPRNDLIDHTSRIFVVPFRGGGPRLVFESTRWSPGNGRLALLDWTADAKYIAVHDVRQGKSALYLLPMKAGVAAGEAEFIRFGEFDEGYTAGTGALVVEDHAARPDNVKISTAPIDSDGRLGAWRRIDVNTGNKNPWPSFSPDGKQVAWVGDAPDPTHKILFARQLATGQDREIYQSAYASLRCQYSIHDARIFCSVEKEKGESELFSVEAESGAVEHIANFPQTRYLVRAGWDDQTFYFSSNGWLWPPLDPPIIEWNRSTGQETVIASADQYNLVPSPDGRLLVSLRDGTLSVRPLSGGESKTLVSGIVLNFPAFATPDGNWIIYQDYGPGGGINLYRVPITGGKPQRIGKPPEDHYFKDLFFSPDSRQILTFKAGEIELWLLENFEPFPKK